MSLGGYKFAGRYCQKGSLTDAQWAERMHACKHAAFWAAAEASGWSVDIGGALDPVGCNYMTKYYLYNGNDEQQFALYTLTKYKYSASSADEEQGYVGVGNAFPQDDSTYTWGYGCTSFIRAGIDSINFDQPFTFSPGTSYLWPMGNWGGRDYRSSTPSLTNSFLNATKVYFGFAVRGGDIICFCKSGTQSEPAVSIASCGGFSALLDGGDAYNYFLMSFQKPSTNVSYESSAVSKDGTVMQFSCPNSSGIHGNTDWKSISLQAYPVTKIGAYTETLPFSTIFAAGVYNADKPLLWGKGAVGVEGVAINNYLYGNSGARPELFTTVANGKYLAIRRKNSTWTYTGINGIDAGQTLPIIYIGWDPSNPDILQDSAWTLYDGT